MAEDESKLETGRSALPRRRTVGLVLHTASHSGPARNFASRFRLMDDELHVFAPGDGPALDLYAGFASVHVAAYERVMMPTSALGVARMASAAARDVRTFRRLFRRHSVDTVVCCTTVTPAAALAARTLGLTSVVYCGELFDDGTPTSRGRRLASRAITTSVPRIADVIVCGSNMVAAQFTSKSRAEVVRLYPPVDPDPPPVDALEARRAFGLPLDRPIVVSVGSLSPGRGQDVAIAALARLDGPRRPVLAIAGAQGEGRGDDDYARSLQDLARGSGLEGDVRFLGPVADVTTLLQGASVFVNPARGAESFGRVAFEAVSVGVPAIVTSTGAQTELLRDEHSALVIAPDDPAALAAAIERVLESPSLAAELVRGAREALRALDPDLDRDRFRRLLDGVTGVNGAQAGD